MKHSQHIPWIALALGGVASAQTVAHRVTGQSHENLGVAADTVGDNDGDGAPDLLLASVGSVRIVSSASGAVLSTLSVGDVDHWIDVAGLNDIDGDGAGDFALSLVPKLGVQQPGEIQVRSGATGALIYSLQGAHNGARLGRGLAALGDVDGDGKADFAATSVGPLGAGRAAIYSGASGAQISMPYAGGTDTVYLDVQRGGDIDNDGAPDLLVTALNHGAYAYSGATGGFLRNFAMVSQIKTAACVGDIDGDGHDDVMLSALVSFEPNILYSGRTGDILLFVPNGAGVPSGIGDVDGDGRDDFAFSRGSAGGMHEIYSGRFLYRMSQIVGPSAWLSVGARLIGLGDVDGDGRAEVAAIDSSYRVGSAPNSIPEGRVWLYSDVLVSAVGVPYAVGGIDALCPCGNNSFAGSGGCMNSSGLGAVLRGYGSSSVVGDDLRLEVSYLPFGSFAVLGMGTVRPASFTPFSEGVRALGGVVRRLNVLQGNFDSIARTGIELGAVGLWTAGDVRQFQVFYRDGQGYCGGGVNFSNAIEVTFTP